MKTFAEAESRLAERLDGYEQRPPQQRLATAVEEIFARDENFRVAHPAAEPLSRTHLFGQAGCGTGKSLGYLIPSILSGRRVIVSVTTKALQDQLACVDLPFLEANLGEPFSWTVLKGRANYFCGGKANDADEAEVPRLAEMVRLASAPGFGGTRADFPFEIEDRVWAQVAAETDDCGAYDCKETGLCHAELARARAKECRIVVVNHALFFTDLIVKNLSEGNPGMLDEYDLVVFDEAHECFPAGTLIDGRAIETIKVGDRVRSFDPETGEVGSKRVSAIMAKPAGDMLMRVTAGETSFVATPNHPIWTQRGWVAAGLLQRGDTLLSHATDTGHRDGLRGVLNSGDDHRQSGEIRLPQAWGGLVRAEVPQAAAGAEHAGGAGLGPLVLGADAAGQPDALSGGSSQSLRHADLDGSSAPGSRGQRGRADRAGAAALVGAGAGVGASVRGVDRSGGSGCGSADALQDRLGPPRPDGRRGGGRRVPSGAGPEGVGRAQGPLAPLARVDRVEVLERGCDGEFERVCPDGLVYNFEVEDWHTYFANGVAVHNCAEVAGNAIGGQFSEGTLRALTGQVRSWAAKFSEEGEEHFSGSIAAVLASGSDLFRALPVPEGRTSQRLREADLDNLAEHLGALYEAIKSLASDLSRAKIAPGVDLDRARNRRDRVRRMGNNTYNRLIEIITADFAEIVRWVEVERKMVRGSWETRKVIKVAPVEVGPALHEMLFSKTPTVMVSATMAVKGSFSFIADRLGVAEGTYTGLDVGSPFDFGHQTRLYVPVTLPEPKGQEVRVWEQQANQEILELVKITRGRALVLFTSVKHMRSAHQAIARAIPYTVKMQGQESVKDLAAWFASDTHGVLFGTKSFFTGFDVRGESLVNVIVAKMPFPVPDEPLTEARCDAIEAKGGSAFADYSIPVMSLVLQQAVGRLIRHTNDKGIVSILDPRMLTKGYGKAIVRDLPPMPIVKTLDEVREFAAEVDLHFGTEPEAAPTTALAF